MPRDKKLSHKKVLEAAKYEFLKNGFEKTSIRQIAKIAGMTSAGLYKHCIDKEDLFSQLVNPVIEELDARVKKHKEQSYMWIVEDRNALFNIDDNEIKIFLDLSEEYSTELQLLLCKSDGTKYENFLQEFITMQEIEFEKVFIFLAENGYKVKSVSKKELHVLLSSYTTAIIEPIIHNYTKEETKECLMGISDFFTPGWMNIMGF